MTPRRFLALTLPAFAVLVVIGALNSLPALSGERVPPDLGYGADVDLRLQFAQVITLAYLGVIYLRALVRWQGEVPMRAWRPAIVVLTLVAWLIVPANSSDILDYLGFGRLVALYGLNPYVDQYSDITDAFSSYVTWDGPMPYGPVMLPPFVLAGWLSVRHVLVGIYALKLGWAGVHLLNSFLVYRIARRLQLDGTLACVTFACNPLALLEMVGNGHNDGVLILCALAGVLAVQSGRYATGIALAFVGAIVKLAGVFWMLPMLVLAARERRSSAIVWGTAISGLLGALIVLWPGCLEALTLLNTQWHFSEDSLHTIAINVTGVDYALAFTADRIIATLLFGAFIAWRLRFVRDHESMVRETGYIVATLLLGYAASVEPWYFTWLVPMAALTTSGRLRATMLVVTLSALALYAVPYGAVEPLARHGVMASVRLAVAIVPPLLALAFYGRFQREWPMLSIARLRTATRPMIGPAA